jgi:hypothetical protein
MTNTTQPDSSATSGAQHEKCNLRLCCRDDTHAPGCTTYDPNRYPDVDGTAPQAATTEQAGAVADEWRVGEFWSSASPGNKVLMLARSGDIEKFGWHKDFIRWVGASPAATTASASGKVYSEEVLQFGIQIEKALCAALGREWTASGISIQSLISELSARAPAPSREAAVPQIKPWLQRVDEFYASIKGRMVMHDPRIIESECKDAEIADWRALFTALAGREAAPLDERARFEAAWLATHPEASFPRRGDGSYLCRSMDRLYEGWRLARAALAQPAAPVVDGELPPLPTSEPITEADGRGTSLTVTGAYTADQMNDRWKAGYSAGFAAASSAPVGVPVPLELAAIGKLLATQNNRYTDQPMFIVQQRRRITGLDTDYCENIIWLCSEDDYSEASEEEAAELEAAYQETGRAKNGWMRTGYLDQWEFVTACFTEQGCKDYLARDGHNLKEPRIYAEGSYRNEEFRAIRNWLLSLAAAPSHPEPAGGKDWKKLANNEVIDWNRKLDVVLDNGVYEYQRDYQQIDWTQVRDWRYSPAGGKAQA